VRKTDSRATFGSVIPFLSFDSYLSHRWLAPYFLFLETGVVSMFSDSADGVRARDSKISGEKGRVATFIAAGDFVL
jgi:hypothetical protein